MAKESLSVKIKVLDPKAVLPKYAKDGDAGMDLTAISVEQVGSQELKYSFGLAFEIPKGYVGYVFPRSSCYNKNQSLTNCVGVIDSGYRGEVSAVFRSSTHNVGSYKVGDRVAQIIIMPIPYVTFEEVEELSDTERGTGGYGSTGN
ncbi:deoxyuridine 5'-triphosphate nucleotidohydrolase [Tenacibaculum phage Gundel_1]|uniref:dUTP diphosphatase n=1 Tax=Tenacibaculum phage Gundel_1 TaxID=2745672 RepID=A0A8E4ZE26_9CAUD|nr:deoxyuridine 5'-triphosphate nucleotidohydrolase [Tenacibaculum phage Gundel_1]QQV91536.1 deoxyuridine 5'-triphosphate nucleotidohydrolase [Tenacibaculum phage Gundel_1]